jgi:hypothetical protein
MKATTRDATSPTATAQEAWIGGGEVCRILGISPHRLAGIARTGTLTRRELPGVNPLYRKSEVEELARRSTRPGRLGA